jgi:hypothetical protein
LAPEAKTVDLAWLPPNPDEREAFLAMMLVGEELLFFRIGVPVLRPNSGPQNTGAQDFTCREVGQISLGSSERPTIAHSLDPKSRRLRIAVLTAPDQGFKAQFNCDDSELKNQLISFQTPVELDPQVRPMSWGDSFYACGRRSRTEASLRAQATGFVLNWKKMSWQELPASPKGRVHFLRVQTPIEDRLVAITNQGVKSMPLDGGDHEFVRFRVLDGSITTWTRRGAVVAGLIGNQSECHLMVVDFQRTLSPILSDSDIALKGRPAGIAVTGGRVFAATEAAGTISVQSFDFNRKGRQVSAGER